MQYLIDSLQSKIDKLEQMKGFVSELPDLSEFNEIAMLADEDCVYISLPFDWSLYTKIRAKFSGWRCDHYWTTTQHSDNDVSQHKSLWKHGGNLYFDGPYASIALHSKMNGSVCSIEQVGIVEVPQYKVVCK